MSSSHELTALSPVSNIMGDFQGRMSAVAIPLMYKSSVRWRTLKVTWRVINCRKKATTANFARLQDLSLLRCGKTDLAVAHIVSPNVIACA